MFVMSSCLLGMVMVQASLVAPICIVAIGCFGLSTLAVDRANREVRRISNNTVSPVLSIMAEMRQGSALVRAMKLQRCFTRRTAAHVDDWSRLFFLFKSVQTWGSHVANYITVSIGASSAFFLMGTREERGTELAGKRAWGGRGGLGGRKGGWGKDVAHSRAASTLVRHMPT